MTALVHVAIAAFLLCFGMQAARKHTRHLVTFDLSAPPPAPPAPSAEKPRKLDARVASSATPRPVAAVPAISLATAPAPVQPLPAPVAEAAPPPPAAPASAPASAPSMVSSNSLGTKLLSGDPPRYPTESRRRREQGTVVLSLILSLDGRVASIVISQSSGSPRLDDAALKAVRSWRWSPTLRDGAPVMVKGVVEIPFLLRS